ncbi:monooxygenase [Nonomuraea sp. NPDC050328]|uniref:monooxygenase n=1 Tax=Nonomuraea sp. NPDC050328 TaxID=3364361 RepID=UPI0037ADF41B
MRRIILATATGLVLTLAAACGTTAPGQKAGQASRPAGQPAQSGQAEHGGLHGTTPAATPAAEPLRAGERFQTLSMPAAHTPKPPGGGTDEYRCFLVDPGVTAPDTYLTGTQFVPGNTAIVHHAIFFSLDPAKTGPARALDAKSPGEGWTCFGDAGLNESDWIGHWAPGTNEVLLDPSLGYPLKPGSALVMQIHYSTLAMAGAEPGPDRSSVRMRLATGARTALRTETYPAPIELPCTAQEKGPLCEREAAVADVGKRFGADAADRVGFLSHICDGGKPKSGPVQACDLPFERPMRIHALAGHMHLLGRSIKVELNPGKPDGRTLLNVPEYNFDNQAIQPLPEPVAVGKGDTIRVTCTHDAGLRAQLPLLSKLPPRYVVWGEGTQDEMCLGILVTSAGKPAA